MTPRQAGEIVLAWEEAVGARDVERVLALVDPEVELVGPRGRARGHAVLTAWLGQAGLTLETRRRFAHGGEVVHEQWGRWHHPETGDVVNEAALATHYRVSGGRVVYLARYDDLAAALEHAGLDETFQTA